VTRPSWLGLPLAASALGHVALGWQLHAAPLAPAELATDRLVVRTLELPPPEPRPREAEPPKPEPPKPEPPKPEPPKREPPKRRARATPALVPPPSAPPASSEPEPPPPPAATAPSALLALPSAGSSGGSVVQLAGAPLAGWATSTAGQGRAPAPPAAASFTKLSDLSRKPRAPALDARLRDNYPPEQRRRGVEGQAEVQVVIERSGRVGEIRVISESAAGFAEACRRTLRGSLWGEPMGPDGQPVRTRLSYRCRFRIER
jgi:TonB family protein